MSNATIIKRSGKTVDFDTNRIVNAISKAMLETELGLDLELCYEIASDIENCISGVVSVEDIQNMIELKLMDSNRKDVAKQYIVFRSMRDKFRIEGNNNRLLTDEFISKYKHLPIPMNQLGIFVYYRTYSRWLENEKRREYWWETIRRAVEYNCSLVQNTSREEAELLFDNIYWGRQYLSGRTFWVGGTLVAEKYPMANFNCAFTIIDSFEAIKDLNYLLLVGTGVGIRILKEDVDKLPKVRTNIELINKDYSPMPKNDRENMTSIEFINDVVKITVGDSKEGWVQALDYYLQMHWNKDYRHIKTIIMDYDNVRPKGEKLKTFGGTASGHTSIKNMFNKINTLLIKLQTMQDSNIVKLRPIDCLDIANIIGENVVVGGVRRTAEIALIDSEDDECIKAKSNIYVENNGKWEINPTIAHRQMSNNSIYYKDKPTRERLHWQIEQMRYSGEPAWINSKAGSKRRNNFNGVNPCGEVLLDNRGLCNLTTLNVMAFVHNGILDITNLLIAQRLSVRAGYRMTMTDLELHKWNEVQKRDRLIGCSLTGWQDMVNATGLTKSEEKALLRQLRDIAKSEVEEYSKIVGGNPSLLSTTIKPEGTLSQLVGVSSGIHYSHSPYYIRRVRINANDSLVKVCEELGYPVFPEVGQSIENCSTKVIEFPVKAPIGKTKYDVSAIEQLENYKLFMENYVEHNVSITVHVRPNEWEEVEQWIWDNWDDVVAVSFLSLEDSFYKLLPYEAITEEEYNEKVKGMKPFLPSLIAKYEVEETEIDLEVNGCEAGVCPVR